MFVILNQLGAEDSFFCRRLCVNDNFRLSGDCLQQIQQYLSPFFHSLPFNWPIRAGLNWSLNLPMVADGLFYFS